MEMATSWPRIGIPRTGEAVPVQGFGMRGPRLPISSARFWIPGPGIPGPLAGIRIPGPRIAMPMTGETEQAGSLKTRNAGTGGEAGAPGVLDFCCGKAPEVAQAVTLAA